MEKKRMFKKLRIYALIAVISVILIYLGKLIFTIPSGKEDIGYISFYEKLAAAEPVNVLIVGDSIAAGTGASSGNSWAARLPEAIKEKYGSTCNVTNISMGGNTSYAGVYRVKELDNKMDYDLAIICYGENDADDENFSTEYESIIRAIMARSGNCSILSILESSQREYTNKMNQIIEIADYYNIPVVDTISAFNSGEYKYEELVGAPDDIVHPNDLGHSVYLETLAGVIDEEVTRVKETQSSDLLEYNETVVYGVEDFGRIGLSKYKLNLDKPVKAAVGIYRSYVPGENGLKIYSNGKLIYDSSFEWNYGFGQEHIDKIISEPCEFEDSLTVEFSSYEAAKYFKGIMLSDISD
ncbi:SGNH/GDSL hydrolase family protein [Butyrivibrio sp. AE2015]|uniref:SGNH/GDSL hydrolase family protein n=1 Tax=Butyrivibrio sp. AE2015 TaxID=1280663 RepID=UPI0003B73CE5|nr:SGNH/GDSL hydrolase family protein [Butyrivibrio sp. AE2015]